MDKYNVEGARQRPPPWQALPEHYLRDPENLPPPGPALKQFVARRLSTVLALAIGIFFIAVILSLLIILSRMSP